MSVEALHDACKRDDLGVVKAMLMASKDPDALLLARGHLQNTALHFAVKSSYHLVEYLLRVSKDPDALLFAQNQMRCTALHEAASQAKYSLVELFLKTSKNPDALVSVREEYCFTALHAFCICLHPPERVSDIMLLQELLKASKDPESLVATRCENGKTALESACYAGTFRVARELLPYYRDLPHPDVFIVGGPHKNARAFIESARRRRTWAYLQTSLPEDLERALIAWWLLSFEEFEEA